MGQQQIERGNVYAARLFFKQAAKAGLCKSAVALAATYDPEELARRQVLGVQPDAEAAEKWHEKARDLCSIEALRPEWAVRQEEKALAMLERAVDKPAANSVLARFRAAYTSGDGLAYVVIKDEKGEHIYRFGDESRSKARYDTHRYSLFNCNIPHVYVSENAEDKAALQTATVVKPEDPRFEELDGRYVSECNDPQVKSAIKKN
jgi:hypothetical protein